MTPQFNNLNLSAVSFFVRIDTRHGPARFSGVPAWFSQAPEKVAGLLADLGEDTRKVLAEFGFEEAAAMRAAAARTLRQADIVGGAV